MKNILYLLLGSCLLWGCSDDDGVMMSPVEQDAIWSKPISGGAVLYYNLPADKEVFSINVRYRNAQGTEVLKTGSYGCDSLIIDGFDKARKDVPASVTLCDRSNQESAPLDIRFDTQDSGPVAFFDNIHVNPSWNGFWLSYDVPETAKGMAHIFYVGENPESHKMDTLLLNSFTFMGGADTLTFSLKQQAEQHTVIVRTEDFKGYMVGEQVWEKVQSYNVDKMDSKEITFYDPAGLSIEDPDALLGSKYLFDGDLKGETRYYLPNNEQFLTFLAGPNAFGQPFILDLQKERMIAQLRFYGILNFTSVPSGYNYKYGMIWNGVYHSKTPCKVRIFVSNDKDDDSSWIEYGSFSQDRKIDKEIRWDKRCIGGWYTYILNSLEEVQAAEPAYFSIDFPATGASYRYVKIVVDETYAAMVSYYDQNPNKYVTLHEIEVYTKKD